MMDLGSARISKILFPLIHLVGSFHQGDGMTILTYHSIDESRSKISIAPSDFVRQMRFLKEHHYEVLSLSHLSTLLKTSSRFPRNAVVLTFDDGYQNTYLNAFPVLQDYGFPATVFIATQFCGKKNDWPQPDFTVPSLPMLSWKEVEEMGRYHVEIGAHTHSHPNLIELPQIEMEKEVLTSKRKIEEKTGNPCRFFAYPFGKAEGRMKGFVASEFIAACSTRLDRVTPRSDIHLLERVGVGYVHHLSAFKAVISSSLPLFLSLKRGYRKTIGKSQ